MSRKPRKSYCGLDYNELRLVEGKVAGYKTGYDLYARIGVVAESRVAKKFEKSGIVPFPEVDLEKAAEIVGCSPALLLSAVRSWQLRARNVRGVHLIRIIDLWYFAVSKESGKILKNRR